MDRDTFTHHHALTVPIRTARYFWPVEPCSPWLFGRVHGCYRKWLWARAIPQRCFYSLPGCGCSGRSGASASSFSGPCKPTSVPHTTTARAPLPQCNIQPQFVIVGSLICAAALAGLLAAPSTSKDKAAVALMRRALLFCNRDTLSWPLHC